MLDWLAIMMTMTSSLVLIVSANTSTHKTNHRTFSAGQSQTEQGGRRWESKEMCEQNLS